MERPFGSPYHNYAMTIPRERQDFRTEKAVGHICNRKFGRMWHRARWFSTPFEPGARCYCCDRPATRRIWANIWGTATQYDVCDEHAERYANKNVEEVCPRERPVVAAEEVV